MVRVMGATGLIVKDTGLGKGLLRVYLMASLLFAPIATTAGVFFPLLLPPRLHLPSASGVIRGLLVVLNRPWLPLWKESG